MSYTFQVTVDAAEPHVLADWWAETLGWQVEPSNEDFIRDMIAKGYATEGDTTRHRGTLVWKEGTAIRHPDGLERAPRLLFQLVPEGKRDELRTGHTQPACVNRGQSMEWPGQVRQVLQSAKPVRCPREDSPYLRARAMQWRCRLVRCLSMTGRSSPHDAVFRRVLGEPANAASQLRAVLPTGLTDQLDLTTLTRVPGSFVAPNLRWRHPRLRRRT